MTADQLIDGYERLCDRQARLLDEKDRMLVEAQEIIDRQATLLAYYAPPEEKAKAPSRPNHLRVVES